MTEKDLQYFKNKAARLMQKHRFYNPELTEMAEGVFKAILERKAEEFKRKKVFARGKKNVL